MMDIKPFRDIDEHEVLNLFSTVEGNLPKGTFVQIVSFDPDNHSGPGASMPNVPHGAYSVLYETYAKVQSSQGVSGVATGTIGLLLCDVVASYPPFVVTIGEQMDYFDQILSGRTVPILTRGVVEISGWSGTPYPGAKGTIGISGQLLVASANTVPNVGTFLSQSGVDGYAVFKVHCI